MITISTHTLTWSVTRQSCVLSRMPCDFNSHAHVERDQAQRYTMAAIRYFNSHAHVERDNTMTNHANGLRISTHTLTWSVTRQSCVLSRMPCDFNSHAHVERDRLHWLSSCWKTISTHTLTWSVTSMRLLCQILQKISTHTLTWSVTCAVIYCHHHSKDFNSHAHVERDEKFWADIPGIYVFQLTRSRGA